MINHSPPVRSPSPYSNRRRVETLQAAEETAAASFEIFGLQNEETNALLDEIGIQLDDFARDPGKSTSQHTSKTQYYVINIC